MVTASTPSNYLARASGLHKRDLSQSMLNQQSRVRSFHVRRLKQMDLTSRQKEAVRRHLWKRKRGKDSVMQWVRIDAQQAYDQEGDAPKSKESTEYSEYGTPLNGTAILGDDGNIARALRDFGVPEDEGRHPDSSFLSANNVLGRQSFQPLRATALKRLEEAEERPTMAYYAQQNPFNPANGGVKPLKSSKNPYSGSIVNPLSSYGLININEHRECKIGVIPDIVIPMEGQDCRFMVANDTARSNVSTGYVRHDNGQGVYDWTPAGTVIGFTDTCHRMDCEEDMEDIASLTFQEKKSLVP
ncbi:hypothetical protein PsorP6_019040 [Peronosclerospora sorghi]|nr:hypothetical protein PsorP6_019040 [Peronosclerospora sorghi]